MSRSFGLDATSALEALRDAVERFDDDDLNEDLARDCALKAWQLCDHVFVALGQGNPFPNLRALQDHVRAACPELGYLQDICIESKHGRISSYAPRIVEARFQEGAFSRDFSRDFDVCRLEIELPGGQAVWFIDVIERAVAYWSQFFKHRGLA